jgi:hypothetical protein
MKSATVFLSVALISAAGITTKDRRDYEIVASGGFFTPGKDSIVVPIRSLKLTQGRESFFLPISKEAMKTVPLMPDQD